MRPTIRSGMLVLAAVLATAGLAHAQSPDALTAADRLIKVQDPTAMMKDMAGKIAATLPASQQQAYIDAMTEPAFIERFTVAARSAMAKHMTAEELNALADFYEKPVARSAMSKMGNYMAELMPFIQTEMMNIANKLQDARKDAPGETPAPAPQPAAP